MEKFFSFRCIVPSSSLAKDNLRALFDHLATVPNSTVMPLTDELTPHGTFDQFKSVGGANIRVSFVELFFDGTMNDTWKEEVNPPAGYDMLFIDAPDWTLQDMPEQLDALVEVLIDIFLRLQAIYGVGNIDDAFEAEHRDFYGPLDVVGGLHFISGEVLERLDSTKPPLPERYGDLAGGLWLRYDEDYFFGMDPKYKDSFSAFLPHLKKAIIEVVTQNQK